MDYEWVVIHSPWVSEVPDFGLGVDFLPDFLSVRWYLQKKHNTLVCSTSIDNKFSDKSFFVMCSFISEPHMPLSAL